MTAPDPQKTDEALGNLIRLHRKSAGLSQEDLGRSVGTSAQQIQKYEVGLNRVSVHRLLAIAQAVGVDAVALLSELENALRDPEASQTHERAQELAFLGSSTGRILTSSLVEMDNEDFSAALATVAKLASRSQRK
ncbi:MAG: helix-turn-helix transcriptional regulator [Pseudomonadota bacterium]